MDACITSTTSGVFSGSSWSASRRFHHHREKRWLKGPLVAFVPADPSPMGFNLGAVEPGTAASISHDEARRRSVADDAMKGGPR